MSCITIWALESDYDEATLKCIAEKLIHHMSINNLTINSAGKSAITKKNKNENDPSIALNRKVELYLMENNCVIFVIDTDGLMTSHQRRQEKNSLINQIERVLNEKKFKGKVYLALAKCELEAWLLIDCEGIFCYFARKQKIYKEKCRERINNNQKIKKVIGKYQKGNTELITEAESGGKGVKEYLMQFSKEILKIINPKMPDRNISEEKYRESLSSKIVDYIQINEHTLKRNDSLKKFADLIKKCSENSTCHK